VVETVSRHLLLQQHHLLGLHKLTKTNLVEG